jgi:hypothetical protein
MACFYLLCRVAGNLEPKSRFEPADVILKFEVGQIRNLAK